MAYELVRLTGGVRLDIDAINTARGVGLSGAPITPEAWAASYAEARRQLAGYRAAGIIVIYDGHTFQRAERSRLRRIAADYTAPVTTIYIAVSEDEARARLRQNRLIGARHDVPDDLFAQAVAIF